VSTLAHRYRQETGEPPMLKLTRLRINLAKGLLLKGQPLKAIAEAAGFSDAFHLSKTFKRLEGAAPKHFLASLRAGR
jgi:transcriptional regulator GlxA family with amidase domain